MLQKFLLAQNTIYPIALREIQSGRKKSHWMWFIFPQIEGLGNSDTAKFYAIKNLEQAVEYLNHPVLGARLRTISNALLNLPQTNPHIIFGSPDDVKLKSSMTLFDRADATPNTIFKKVIDKFYHGEFDEKTIRILEGLKQP